MFSKVAGPQQMKGLSLVRPTPVEARLEGLTEAIVELLRDGAQTIRTEVKVVGTCPEPFVPVVLQVAEEMVDNAVRHGMRLRLVGYILVSLWASPGYRVNLTVRDDGWGPGAAEPGEGHSIIAGLAGQFGGSVSLTRNGPWTVAAMTIPDRLSLRRSSPRRIPY
jgi:two-component sensor histidine kinase